MRILVVNCGSSSLKTQVFDVDGRATSLIAAAEVDGIGAGAADYRTALGRALGDLGAAAEAGIDVVAHRVVQGGRFVEPALITAEVLAAVRAAAEIAPLHNRASVQGIEAAAERFPQTPTVAVFDTAFHASLAPEAAAYALPADLAARYGIRRHGYHGIAHRSMMLRYAEIAGVPAERVSLITLQLGGGCSITAVRAGRSTDTSMGFTPLEGLMMGTRSGDIDPAVIPYLAREAGMSPTEAEEMLNQRSGLLGVSGASPDVRVLLELERQGDERAHLALEMFCYRARKYIGAYLAAVPDAQAVVFGGGIGEHVPEVRRRICTPLATLGLTVDVSRNDALTGAEGCFSTDDSRLRAYVIPADEGRIIARDAFELLTRGNA